MKFKIIFLLSLISSLVTGQKTIFVGDTLNLISGQSTYQKQWEFSTNGFFFNALTNETEDTLNVISNLPGDGYFRLKLTNGTCAPVYSDTLHFISIPHTDSTVYQLVNNVQYYITPPTNSILKFKLYGAAGKGGFGSNISNSSGGEGGYVYGEFDDYESGDSIFIYVGGSNAYNGGGAGGTGFFNGGNGGGATDIRFPDTLIDSRIAVAAGGGGGGGGASTGNGGDGGDGGALSGENGGGAPLTGSSAPEGGFGGTQLVGGNVVFPGYGGCGNGNFGESGQITKGKGGKGADGKNGIGTCTLESSGAGGAGGGYWGGSGGSSGEVHDAADQIHAGGGGGGGGSSYVGGLTNTSVIRGGNNGDGLAKIYYEKQYDTSYQLIINFDDSQLNFEIDGGTDQLLCSGDSALLNGNLVTGNGIIVYFWDNNVIDGQKFIPTYSQNYIVVGENQSNGCTDRDTVNVGIETKIVLQIDNFGDEIFGNDGFIDLGISSGGSQNLIYDWDNDGTGDFDDTQDIYNLSTGIYSVEVRGLVCASTLSWTIASRVGMDEINSTLAKLYPSIVTDILTIENISDENLNLKVMDYTGKIIMNKIASGKLTKMDLTGIQSGYYFVQVINTKGQSTFKIYKN